MSGGASDEEMEDKIERREEQMNGKNQNRGLVDFYRFYYKINLQDERKPQQPSSSSIRRPKLTAEEMEERRKAMMTNANWR